MLASRETSCKCAKDAKEIAQKIDTHAHEEKEKTGAFLDSTSETPTIRMRPKFTLTLLVQST